ncbi:MAG: LTA synthase family protein [Acidobacteriota bacterium]
MRALDRQVLLIGSCFALANLLGWIAYRLLFLSIFDFWPPWVQITQACLAGVRVDLALIGYEFSLFCLLAQVPRLGQARFLIVYWWTLGYLHFVACSGAHWFFRERQEHFGSILLRYLTRLEEPFLAVQSFLAFHPWLALFLVGGSIGYWWTGARAGARLARLWPSQAPRSRERVWLLAFAVGALMPTVDLAPRKWNMSKSGWVVRGVHAGEYAVFDHFGLNQAIINPFYDLFRVQVAAALQPAPPEHFTRDEAARRCLAALGRSAVHQPYPLFTELTSTQGTDIRNIVIVQIESLSTDLLESASGGETVMPFLRGCASQGLYFPNLIQAANQTTGSVFCLATGLPKENIEARVRRFADWELNGYYATLPRILSGKGYQHFAFHGGRSRLTDFGAFMGNQGYQSFGYRELSEELKQLRYAGEREDSQGLLDGPFLEASARIILKRRQHYTAQILTTTSHPPCRAPAWFQSKQTDDTLRTFQYVDSAMRRFVEIMKGDPGFQQTLFLITGDHARPTRIRGLIDTLRVPLILFSPALSAKGLVGKRNEWWSQLDILPTVLDLIDGRHVFAGIGQSVLGPRRDWRAFSIRGSETLYFRDSYLLVHCPLEGRSRLYLFQAGDPNPREAGPEHVRIQEDLTFASLAIQETVRRLGRSRKIVPLAVAR